MVLVAQLVMEGTAAVRLQAREGEAHGDLPEAATQRLYAVCSARSRPALGVSVHLPLQEPPRRACPMSCDALQPQHDRDDSAAVARAVGAGAGAGPCATPGAVGDAPAVERRPASAHPRAGARLGQHSANSSRPRPSDPLHVPLKRRAVLWTVAQVKGVAPTTNVAERALLRAVLWRKGSFGADSAAGSPFAAWLLTVVASCRQQGRPLVDFLVTASGATLQGTAAPLLLPTRLG
jgi:hypothetical protein